MQQSHCEAHVQEVHLYSLAEHLVEAHLPVAVYYQQQEGPCYAEGSREFMLALWVEETVHN